MNLEFNLKNKENFKNLKVEIILLPFSDHVNSYRLAININNKYNLVDYGEYFVPYYYEVGPFGSEVLMCESYFQRYRDHENRIKKEYLNKFIRGENNHHVCFYGYFENVFKLNRVYNNVLKSFLIDKFLPYEGVRDNELIEKIKNLKFTR